MAYNVFKRPMFKRGGSTTGTGIMSHVEPRVNAAMGFPTFGLSKQPNQAEIDAFKKSEAQRIQNIRNQPNLFLGPRFTDPNYQSPFKNFFSTNTGFGFMNLSPKNSGQGIMANITGTGTGTDTGMPVDTGDLYDEMLNIQANEAAIKSVNQPPPAPDKDTGTKDGEYKASDIRSEVEKEANMLKELLKKDGDKYSKGEAALIIAGALAEPGTFADKVKKATELAAPVARKSREEDKAITLAAYKLAKEKEIAGAKQTQQEKLIDEYVSANIKDPTNTKSANELRREAVNKYFGGKEDTQKEYNVLQLAQYETPDKSSGKSLLTKALEDKAELEALIASGKKLNENQEQKLARSIKTIETVKKLRANVGFPEFASGGRVGFAEGSEDVDTTDTLKKDIDQAVKPIEATNVAEGDQSVPMKPVQKLSFEELRNRLPKEITNDVVQLIANSEEALQDFSYIRDQEDVNSFNVKYGVNLILPPETV
jgi:hypothetical protein